MRPSPSVVRLAADRSPGFLGLPWSFSRRSPSVLVLLLVGRRGAATLRHRLTAHGAVLLVQRVDLDVVPGGPVDEGLDLGRGGVHALGGDVEVDRDRPGHALLAAVNVGGGHRARAVVGQLVADPLRVLVGHDLRRALGARRAGNRLHFPGRHVGDERRRAGLGRGRHERRGDERVWKPATVPSGRTSPGSKAGSPDTTTPRWALPSVKNGPAWQVAQATMAPAGNSPLGSVTGRGVRNSTSPRAARAGSYSCPGTAA